MQCCPNYKDSLCLTQLVSLSLKHSRRTTEQIIRVGERGAKWVKRQNKEGHFRAGITKEEEMFERKTQLYIMMLMFSLVSLIKCLKTANILITKRGRLCWPRTKTFWLIENLRENDSAAPLIYNLCKHFVLLVSVTSLKSYWAQKWSLCKLWSDWSQKGWQLSNDHAASFSFICACRVWFKHGDRNKGFQFSRLAHEYAPLPEGLLCLRSMEGIPADGYPTRAGQSHRRP